MVEVMLRRGLPREPGGQPWPVVDGPVPIDDARVGAAPSAPPAQAAPAAPPMYSSSVESSFSGVASTMWKPKSANTSRARRV